MRYGDVEIVIVHGMSRWRSPQDAAGFGNEIAACLGQRAESLAVRFHAWSESEPLAAALAAGRNLFGDERQRRDRYQRDSAARLLVVLGEAEWAGAVGDQVALHAVLRGCREDRIVGLGLGPASAPLSEAPGWEVSSDAGADQWIARMDAALVRVFASRQMAISAETDRWVAGGYSSVGRRDNNEDSYSLLHLEVNGSAADLLVVCDGVGGNEAGELASRLAVESIPRLVAHLTPLLRGGARGNAEAIQAEVTRHFLTVCDDIKTAEGVVPGLHGATTTLVGALRVDNDVLVFWSGDSRCYRLRDGRLEVISRDHSVPVEELGLDPDAAQAAADRRITRYLAADMAESPEYVWTDTRPGDVWLLCSDGIAEATTTHRYLESYLLLALIQALPPKDAIEAIVQTCWRTVRDNCTAVLALDGVPALDLGDRHTPSVFRNRASAYDLEPQLQEAMLLNAGRTFAEGRAPLEALPIRRRFRPVIATADGNLVLAVYDERGQRREYDLDVKSVFGIGSVKDAEIALDDGRCASQHAQISRVAGDAFRLVPCDSDNGTWIGARTAPIDLGVGDEFLIGTYLFRIENRRES